MAKVKYKQIKEKALKMKNAWDEGASEVTEFRNTTKTQFDADIAAGEAIDNELEDLKTQMSMKEDERENIYRKVDANTVDVRKGVEGHKDFGDDSPLFGSMGFVRKSERKSGLTRKTKADKNEKDEDK